MNIILRNFLTTLRRYRLASILNIVGLGVAFAAFIVIMTQVKYERNFDRSYSKSGRIYRLELNMELFGNNAFIPVTTRQFAEFLVEGSPLVETIAITPLYVPEIYINVEPKEGNVAGFKELMTTATSSIVDVLDFEITEGTIDAFQKPDNVIIPESMAEKMFGDNSAIGKTLTVVSDDSRYEIGAVYKDFPANSSFPSMILRNLGDTDTNAGVMGNFQYSVFIVLTEGASREELTEYINRRYAESEYTEMGKIDLRITPIEDIYYQTDTQYDTAPKGNRSMTDILFVIALLVITIAAINFVNFSTSLTPIRIKSINTQKVLGSPTAAIRLSLVAEAVGICLIAFCLALFLVYLFETSGLSSMFLTSIDMGSNVDILGLTLAVALAAGLISGVYPAFYMTSFAPALVLKGSFGMSAKGRRMRTALISFQFIVSTGLIIAAAFFNLQNGYMRNFDTGLDSRHIITSALKNGMTQKEIELLKNELKSNPLVTNVSFADNALGLSDLYSLRAARPSEQDQQILFSSMDVSNEFPAMMGMKIIEGRDFLESDNSGEGIAIINEKLKNMYDLEVGQTVDNQFKVVGVVPDFNFKTLRHQVEPLAMILSSNRISLMYVKYSGDPAQAVAHVKRSLNKIDPYYPVKTEFYDEGFNVAYEKERKSTRQITLFSLLAVVISLVGIFGLVVFETQYRRKEIGVRKVFGSTVGEILAMLNRNFAVMVVVCFVIAAPMAYMGVTVWLKNFAYRTPLHWWVFALAFMAVVAITVLTVTIQSWRAATANPVDSLKNN